MFDRDLSRQERAPPFARPECVVVCTHGGSGENGEVQGLLSVLKLPYTCASVEGSAVGMNKVLSKRLFDSLGLRSAIWRSYHVSMTDDEIADDAVAALGLPLCVKPCRQGSSIGVAVCRDKDAVKEAVAVARCFDDDVLIERAFVNFEEVNCACLTRGGEVVVSETERIVPWHEMLDYEDKYLRGAKEIKAATEKIYRALGARGVVRVDFFVADGSVYVGEVNTVPGSLAAYLFKPLGMSARDERGGRRRRIDRAGGRVERRKKVQIRFSVALSIPECEFKCLQNRRQNNIITFESANFSR